MQRIVQLAVPFALIFCLPAIHASVSAAAVTGPTEVPQCATVRQAVEHLLKTYGRLYPQGGEYLDRLAQLEQRAAGGENISAKLNVLRRAALLDHPRVRDLRILLVRRRPKDLSTARIVTEHDRSIGFSGGPGREIGFPSNHECNASLERHGYDNEIAILGSDGRLTTLYRPDDGGYVGEVDLHWDGQRLLFTKSDSTNWRIWEIHSDGSGLRQVSQMPDDVDCMDACYLPSGRIVFGSTASYQSVPCWHGQKRVSNLYVMDTDGTQVRQLCFDQDHDFHPCVLPTGQILYHRWDYTGISHVFLRPLMVMNPDGTGQRAVYGSNSWFPNSLYFPRPVPDRPNGLVAILSGYHGVHRMGQFVRIDLGQGWQEEEGLVQRISGRGQRIQPRIRDALVDGDWPKFLHPYPISSDLFLVSCWQSRQGSWGIYLADLFDNLVLVRAEPGWALLEPIPLVRRPVPPVIPDRVDLQQDEATVYLHDVHLGPGLAGVPRGVIKKLRVIAYHFGYRGLAGSDKIGYGGPWDAMQIVGTVPLEADGSAHFRVPANTPLAVQVLDDDGKAVQLMRSWFSAMPGEQLSCVGCHETPGSAPETRLGLAAQYAPRAIDPWYGPPRGFDFAREVQPVLDRYCASCHDGTGSVPLDLRSEEQVPTPKSVPIGYARRLHPQMMKDTGGKLSYTPAYLALVHYIRRPNIEDDVSLLTPGEYHADTSELIQILREGHYDVELDSESWQRLITWIDLNGPCHGTWQDVYPIPDDAYSRRKQLQRRFGGPQRDPEQLPAPAPFTRQASRGTQPTMPPVEHRHSQTENLSNPSVHLPQKTVDLGDGVTLQLVQLPAGEFFVDGSADPTATGPSEEVAIERSFWMGTCEVTNRQFHMFDPQHESGYYGKRHADPDDRGLLLNEAEQPVVRVSWNRAQEFCRWLSQRTGMSFRLPTDREWEYACRGKTSLPLSYGSLNDDFSPWANLADRSFSRGLMNVPANRVYPPGVTQVTGGVPHLLLEGAKLSDARFNDGAVVTTAVASYRPNRWGLHDMHGNVSEWTQSASGPSMPDGTDDDVSRSDATRRIVRGGSFFDRPARSRSSFRLDYFPWQRVFNVGFRVVAEVADPVPAENSTSSKPDRRLRLAFITCCRDAAFFEPVKKGMRDAAEQLQADCQWLGTDDVDVEAQAALVRQALAQGYDGIALSIIDDEAFDEVVQLAIDKGVPVVAFNVDDHATPNARLSSVSQKLYEAGRQLADHVADSIPDGSHVLLTMHDEGVSALEDRRRGQQDVLNRKNIRWTVITTGSDPQQGAEKIADTLRKQSEIRIVLSTGQSDTEAAGSAIEKQFAGQGFWAAGFDLSPETLRLIQAGHIRCTVDQQPYIQGYYPVVQLVFYLRHGILPSDIDAGATIIDRSNVDRVIELTKGRYR